MGISIRKETFSRLHSFCCRGEKHDNMVNRLINEIKIGEIELNISDETKKKLFIFTGSNDIDEALNMLFDRVDKIRRQK